MTGDDDQSELLLDLEHEIDSILDEMEMDAVDIDVGDDITGDGGGDGSQGSSDPGSGAGGRRKRDCAGEPERPGDGPPGNHPQQWRLDAFVTPYIERNDLVWIGSRLKRLRIPVILPRTQKRSFKSETAFQLRDMGVRIARAIRDREPVEISTLCRFGNALSLLGILPMARRFHLAAISIDKDSADAWYGLGLDLIRQGEYKEAFEALEKSHSLDADNAHCTTLLGFVNLELEERSVARKLFRSVRDDPAVRSESLYGEGLIAYEEGKLPTSLKRFKEVLKLDPRNSAAWTNSGIVLDELGRNEEAVAAYREALRLNPKNVLALCNLGVAYDRGGDLILALDAYNKALAIDPKCEEALFNRGNAYDDLGELENALASYEAALELQPASAETWYNKGIILERLNRYDDALQSYEEAIAIDAEYSAAWCNKGIVYDELESKSDALVCYDKAIKYDAKMPQAWYNKGTLLEELGDLDSAIRCFENVLDLDKGHERARKHRNRCMYEWNRFTHS